MSFIFSGLLHYMCQLMCQQPSPLAHPRRILPCPEHNIPPKGKGTGIDRLGYVGCPCVTVYTYVVEIHTEARLIKSALRLCQRLTTAPDGIDARFEMGCGLSILPSEEVLALLPAACEAPLHIPDPLVGYENPFVTLSFV